MSTFDRAIAISGDLGSGKSTVGRLLAEVLAMRFLSTGEIHRQIAMRSRLSTLELNRRAETDTRIDEEVDQVLKNLASTGEALVVDSRMAWWFIRSALAIHFTVYPKIGAERAFRRDNQTAEHYSDPEQAWAAMRSRADSERQRFRRLYNVEVERLSNYDLVVDTSSAEPSVLAERILELLQNGASDARRPRLYLDPAHIFGTEDIRVLRSIGPTEIRTLGSDEYLRANPIQVCYSYPYFFAVDGHKRLSAAIMSGRQLIPADLVAEGDDLAYDQLSADDLFAELLRFPARAKEWIYNHPISLEVPEEPSPSR